MRICQDVCRPATTFCNNYWYGRIPGHGLQDCANGVGSSLEYKKYHRNAMFLLCYANSTVEMTFFSQTLIRINFCSFKRMCGTTNFLARFSNSYRTIFPSFFARYSSQDWRGKRFLLHICWSCHHPPGWNECDCYPGMRLSTACWRSFGMAPPPVTNRTQKAKVCHSIDFIQEETVGN